MAATKTEKIINDLKPEILKVVTEHLTAIANETRKHIEKAYMQLCLSDNKTYSKLELKLVSPSTYSLIENYSGDFNKLQAATKRKMEASLFLVE